MFRRLAFSFLLVATGLLLGLAGCTNSSFCPDCDKATTITGLHYQSSVTYVEGSPIAFNEPNPAGGEPVSYTVVAGVLPAGLKLDPATGLITGTPTAPGVYAVTIQAGNSANSVSQALTLTVLPAGSLALNYATPVVFPVGAAITAQTGTLANPTPGITTTYHVTNGTLPPTLAVNPDGSITGTPITPGIYPFTITATNGTRTATATPTYTVTPAEALGLSYPSPLTFPINVLITDQQATLAYPTPGVPTTYSYTGSLPPGLALSDSIGTISGTPTTSGTWAFVITATNGTRWATANLSYTVAGTAPTSLAYTTPVQSTVGQALTDNMPNPAGGIPTLYAVTGTLPPGASLDTGTGRIHGTPTTPGTYTFTVTASNAYPGNATQSVTITVYAMPVANLGANPSTVPVGQASSITPVFSGGTATLSDGTTTTTPISGASLSTGISNTPGATVTYTLTVTNPAGQTDAKSVTVTWIALPPEILTATIPNGGGTLGPGTSSTPGLQGVKLVAPDQGQTLCAASVTLSVFKESTLPDGTPAGGTLSAANGSAKDVAYGCFNFSTDASYPFRAPVTITLPYDATAAGSDLPMPFFWDPTYKAWVAAGLKSIDPPNHLVSFTTVMPGRYAVLAIPGLASALATPSIGFNPGLDSWFQPNIGNFDAPGGSSLGMGSFAAWYFKFRKPENAGTGLFTLFKEGDPTSTSDDAAARALINRLANGTSGSWNNLWTQHDYKLSDVQTGLALITGLKVTGQPQIFLMGDRRDAIDNALATSLYAFNSGTNRFSVLDPNYPGATLSIAWNPATGVFTSYDRGLAYIPNFTKYAFEGQTSIHRLADYDRAFSGASSGWPTQPSGPYATIDITSPSVSDGQASVANASDVTITGTVTNGGDTATHVFWSQNGGPRTAADLDASGHFSLTHVALSDPYGTTLALETTANPCDPTFSYTGYQEFQVKETGLLPWFKDSCFEKWQGPGVEWDVEYGLNNSGYAVAPSPVLTGAVGELAGQNITWTPGMGPTSAIANAGADPQIPSIQKALSGQHSFQVNDGQGSNHASRISSKNVIVPTSIAKPKLSFYWAAVMQDVGHPAAEQPYVDILIQDVTNGYEILFYKHFYAGDSAYPGWINAAGNLAAPSDQVKGIPWQKVSYSVPEIKKGSTLRVTVTAADCTQGGHGGVAYVDNLTCN